MEFSYRGMDLSEPQTSQVYTISTWIPVTQEALDDSAYMSAWMEYRMFHQPPLTRRERLTGRRHWVSSKGFPLTFRVGWRATLYRWTHDGPERIADRLSWRRWVHDRVSPNHEWCPEDDY